MDEQFELVSIKFKVIENWNTLMIEVRILSRLCTKVTWMQTAKFVWPWSHITEVTLFV